MDIEARDETGESVAEAERFELSIPCGMPPFQGGALDHYATPPSVLVRYSKKTTIQHLVLRNRT